MAYPQILDNSSPAGLSASGLNPLSSGGTGTKISEIGIFAGGAGGGGTLVVIDQFADVTVEDGHTEEFTVPFDPRGD